MQDGGLLVANDDDILRLDAGGHTAQVYDVPGAQDWFPLALDPNGRSFWAGDTRSGLFYRFGIGSGDVELGPFDTGAGQPLFGMDFLALCAFGEVAPAPPWTVTTTSTTTTTIPGGSANRPPACGAAVACRRRLRPAGRTFVPVRVRGVTDPDGDPVRVTITGVRQEEPVAGVLLLSTCPDGRGVGTRSAWLRAERADGGDGRVYRVRFRARDGKGGSCRGAVRVCVPGRRRKACLDQGSRFDSTGPCG